MHQIKSVFIESVFPNQEQAKGFQEEIGLLMDETWQQSLAGWLDKFCPPDQCIVIDRLDLDLHFDGDAFNLMLWNERVVKLLKEKLQDELSLAKYDTNDNLSIVSAELSWLKQNIYFWETGYLAWNGISADFDAQKSLSDIKKHQSEIRKNRIDLLELMAGKSFFIRCFMSMERIAFYEFSELLLPDISDVSEYLAEVEETYKLLSPNTLTQRDIAAYLADFWLWLTSFKTDDSHLKISTETILRFIHQQFRAFGARQPDSDSLNRQDHFHDFLQKLMVLSGDNLPHSWRVTIKRLIAERDSLNRKNADSGTMDESVFLDEEVNSLNLRKAEDAKSKAASRQKNTDDQLEWLAEDAGVVLLHPFIQVLFAEGKIAGLDSDRLKSPDLAAQALHYLVFGDSKFQPHRMATIRCLCGLDENHVLQEVKLPESLKSECHQLLSSVIKHWEVLKKTSAEGLRISFLQRKGLLLDKDDHFELKVEKQSYDILLDHLPWSYSVIKLPWMSKPIYVKWYNSM